MPKFNFQKYLVMVLTMTTVTLMFQNCSQHQFEEVEETTAASSGEVIFPDPLDNEEEEDLIIDTEIVNEDILPLFELHAKSTPYPGGYADYYVVFQSDLPYDFEALLKTADTLHQTNSDYGIPNIHYVPTQQKIKIAKGQRVAHFPVLTIDWRLFNAKETFLIGVQTTQCKMAGQSIKCSNLWSGVKKDLD